jgi:damage-control phosphatase, subfamily I
MNTLLDCYSCLIRQSLSAARYAGIEEGAQVKIVHQVLRELLALSPSSSPPVVADIIHKLIRQESGNPDPYKNVKSQSTRDALALYPYLKALVAESPDPLDAAIRLAIAGNVIDYGPSAGYDLMAAVQDVLGQPFIEQDIQDLKDAIGRVHWILYLADNAGETVFDRVLIEQIHPLRVCYGVKSGSVLNDATREDALAAGIETTAEIFETGQDNPGFIFERASAEFKQLYLSAPLIIAKGMANYETLSASGEPIFFLLKVKCQAIAQLTGLPEGSQVVWSARKHRPIQVDTPMA